MMMMEKVVLLVPSSPPQPQYFYYNHCHPPPPPPPPPPFFYYKHRRHPPPPLPFFYYKRLRHPPPPPLPLMRGMMMKLPKLAATGEEIKPPVLIRSVWAHNYMREFRLIDSVLERYPYVAIDTEFPGTYLESSKPYYERTAEEQYSVIKSNVDRLHLIQLGMTFFDAEGNMPDLGTNGSVRYAWQVNFSDFNLFQDPCVPQSIDLLIKNGIDLLFNRDNGIPSCRFGPSFLSSRLARSSSSTSTTNMRWVSFHGGYDFAYLVKVITRKELPETLAGFMEKVKEIFGPQVYDIKNMIRSCNGVSGGGLERVAEQLRVEREAGRSHQAGSDSLLTASVFCKLVDLHFPNQELVEAHAGRLYGLD